jgi:hypothetical protein
MRDYKTVATTNSRKADNLTLFMLVVSCAAFWLANLWTMVNLDGGYVIVKVIAQTLAWLHTIVLLRYTK